MNDFKEWLSDYLRYFLLGFAILGVIIIAILGIRVYQKVSNPTPKTQDTGFVEVETETSGSSDTEKAEDTEKNTGDTEKQTEASTKESTEKETSTTEEVSTEEMTDEGTTEPEKQTEAVSESEKTSEEITEPSTTGETEKEPEYLKVTTTLNFRSEPDGKVITSYGAGRIVKYLGREGDWYKVRVGGQDGYMSAKYLEEVPYEAGMEQEVETEPATEPPTEAAPIYKTLKGTCYLRADTSKESQILGTYYAGSTVQFLEDVGGWYRVRVDGMIGYMGAQFF